MTGADWGVLGGGLAAIGLVNWYFFVAERGAATARVNESGLQEVLITVRGGYDPAVVRVRGGNPIRLLFDRQERSGCSEEVVFPAFGVRRFLPPFEKTAIDLAPTGAGRYEFTCGMSMLRGTLIVE
ncbi:MAG: cupredoxin domain-containing protein [Gemmatimonadaceae bacterium]